MDIALTKVFGWAFILLGLIVIFITIFDTMVYFKAEKEFPEVFVAQEKIESSSSGENALDDMMQNLISDQMSSFIPDGSIGKLLNMSAWSLFAFFMVYAGGKIAEIGFKLVKN